jgi:hypothetical protein
VDLINEEDTWHNFGTAFFSPLSYLLIDLLSNLRLDFTNISSKKSKETLSSAVNNIDFVQSNGVDDFLSLLKFTLWALNKAGLGSNIIVITASSK